MTRLCDDISYEFLHDFWELFFSGDAQKQAPGTKFWKKKYRGRKVPRRKRTRENSFLQADIFYKDFSFRGFFSGAFFSCDTFPGFFLAFLDAFLE